MNGRFRLASAALLLALGASGVEAAPNGVVIVRDVEGLHAALTPENAGRRIVLVRGSYLVRGPLVVPDGATLEGEGVMLGRTLPSGFLSATETRITPDPSLPAFAGDLLTLGNGSAIKGLIVEDVTGRVGNVVAVRSRAPGDTVAATIVRCEIVNPKTSGAGPDGPLGRALVVLTSNRSFGAAPPPDDGAEVSATLTASIIRSSAGGSAIFAINFASRGNVTVVATSNRIFGSLEMTAGVSRPDEVTGAALTIRSERNLYAPLGGATVGWTIDGGSSAPIPGFVAPGASGNVLRFTSIGDRVEGFVVAVAATAAKRHNPTSGPNSNNLIELRAVDLQLRTTGAGAADLVLDGAHADGQYPTGDGNRLRVLLVGVRGSGPRANSYADEVGPAGPQNLGIGNQLEVIGSPEAFRLLNPNVAPAPGAEFFRRLDE